ncbi:hypothetical protein BGZ94_000593, partial [Podila epigama]
HDASILTINLPFRYIIQMALSHLRESNDYRVLLITTKSREQVQEQLLQERDHYRVGKSKVQNEEEEETSSMGESCMDDTGPWTHLFVQRSEEDLGQDFSTATQQSHYEDDDNNNGGDDDVKAFGQDTFEVGSGPGSRLTDSREKETARGERFRADLWSRMELRYVPSLAHVQSFFQCLHLDEDVTFGKTFGGGGVAVDRLPTMVMLVDCFREGVVYDDDEEGDYGNMDGYGAGGVGNENGDSFGGKEEGTEEVEGETEKEGDGLMQRNELERFQDATLSGRLSVITRGMQMGEDLVKPALGAHAAIEDKVGGEDTKVKEEEEEKEEEDEKEENKEVYEYGHVPIESPPLATSLSAGDQARFEYLRLVGRTLSEVKDSVDWIERERRRKPRLIIFEESSGSEDRMDWLDKVVGYWTETMLVIEEMSKHGHVYDKGLRGKDDRESFRLWVHTQQASIDVDSSDDGDFFQGQETKDVPVDVADGNNNNIKDSSQSNHHHHHHNGSYELGNGNEVDEHAVVSEGGRTVKGMEWWFSAGQFSIRVLEGKKHSM